MYSEKRLIIFALLILLGVFDRILANSLIILAPFLLGVKHSSKEDKENSQIENKLIFVYFIIAYLFIFIENTFFFILNIFPFWYSIKLLFSVFLLFPNFKGMKLVYNKILFNVLAIDLDNKSHLKDNIESFYIEYDKKYAGISAKE